jgi:hypothetical protein
LVEIRGPPNEADSPTPVMPSSVIISTSRRFLLSVYSMPLISGSQGQEIMVVFTSVIFIELLSFFVIHSI